MSDKTQTQVEVLRVWQGSAPFWEKHRRTVAAMFAPLTRALIEDAYIVYGQAVLDVGGGAGEPSLTIAGIVGPAGMVTCTDPVAEMIGAAERAAHRRAVTNIKFRQCPAESLPFQDDQFDAALSRLSAMFFVDPIVALREMLRVVKAGGYNSFAVWTSPEGNPFFRIVTDVMAKFVESPPAGPDAPGAFRFAEPGKLRSVLSEAGAVDTTERLLNFNIEAKLPLEQFWTMRVELSDTLRDKVAKLPSDQTTEARKAVEEAARAFFHGDEMSFPARAMIVSGRKGNAH
jgi:ubiquinone/menaquinone biosynthesis C-methylase UbiE